MRVRQWMKVKSDRKISLGHADIDRLGTNYLEKIIKLSPKMNKIIVANTQDIKEFINTDVANVPFIKKGSSENRVEVVDL